MNTAKRIIDKCGGASEVAKMLSVDVSRVHRWTYPKNRGGTGGTIPQKHIQPLIAKASKRGVSLDLPDFFAEQPHNKSPS